MDNNSTHHTLAECPFRHLHDPHTRAQLEALEAIGIILNHYVKGSVVNITDRVTRASDGSPVAPSSVAGYTVAPNGTKTTYATTPVSFGTPSAVAVNGQTVTVTIPNTLMAGDWVTISGASNAAYNGQWQVLTATGSQFTFTTPTALGALTPAGMTVSTPNQYEFSFAANASGQWWYRMDSPPGTGQGAGEGLCFVDPSQF